MQMVNTPDDHVTRDVREGVATWGSLRFAVRACGAAPRAGEEQLPSSNPKWCWAGLASGLLFLRRVFVHCDLMSAALSCTRYSL